MQNAFEPDEVELLAKVVNDACVKLDCGEALKPIVAARVLSFAAKGTRDYDTLLDIAVLKREPLAKLRRHGMPKGRAERVVTSPCLTIRPGMEIITKDGKRAGFVVIVSSGELVSELPTRRIPLHCIRRIEDGDVYIQQRLAELES